MSLSKQDLKDLSKHYVDPHKKISVEVKEKDLPIIIKDTKLMYILCFIQRGLYPGALAIAHQQINKKNPLRFFVTNEKKIIINPVIIRHTNTTIDSKEGCMSFPDNSQIIVQRYNKCEIEYQTISDDKKLLINKKCSLSGLTAKIYQHEIDHFDCKYIF